MALRRSLRKSAVLALWNQQMLVPDLNFSNRRLRKLCTSFLLKLWQLKKRVMKVRKQISASSVQYLVLLLNKLHATSHQGCGFFPEDFFDVGTIKKNCDAIQVRIIGPKIGLAKGMLLKKRGISCIQLPSSMIKAPASKTCTESWVAVVITNSFPSEGNMQMGRFWIPTQPSRTRVGWGMIPENRWVKCIDGCWLGTASKSQLLMHTHGLRQTTLSSWNMLTWWVA